MTKDERERLRALAKDNLTARHMHEDDLKLDCTTCWSCKNNLAWLRLLDYVDTLEEGLAEARADLSMVRAAHKGALADRDVARSEAALWQGRFEGAMTWAADWQERHHQLAAAIILLAGQRVGRLDFNRILWDRYVERCEDGDMSVVVLDNEAAVVITEADTDTQDPLDTSVQAPQSQSNE